MLVRHVKVFPVPPAANAALAALRFSPALGTRPGGDNTPIEDCENGVLGVPKRDGAFLSSARCATSSSGGGNLSVGAIVGIALAGIGAVVLAAVVALCCIWWRRKQAEKAASAAGETEEGAKLGVVDAGQEETELFPGVTPPPDAHEADTAGRPTLSLPPARVGPQANSFLEQSAPPDAEYPIRDALGDMLDTSAESKTESKTTGSLIGDSSG